MTPPDLRDERADALRQADEALAEAAHGYLEGELTALPVLDALRAWRALVGPAAGGEERPGA